MKIKKDINLLRRLIHYLITASILTILCNLLLFVELRFDYKQSVIDSRKMVQAKGSLTRRQKKYLAKKDSILKSAITIFSAKGFNKTSIEEVAEGADFGKGSIYHYFESKEEILDAIICQKTEEILSLINSVSNSDLPPLTKLERLITAIMNFLQENPQYFIITIREFHPIGSPPIHCSAPHKRYSSFYEQQNIIIEDIIREAQQARLIAPMDVRELTNIVIGMVNHSILYWIKKRPSKDFVEWMSFGEGKNHLGNYFQKRIQVLLHILLDGVKIDNFESFS